MWGCSCTVSCLWISWLFPSQVAEFCLVPSALQRHCVSVRWSHCEWGAFGIWCSSIFSLSAIAGQVSGASGSCSVGYPLITTVSMLTKAAVIFRSSSGVSSITSCLKNTYTWIFFFFKCLLQLCTASHLFQARTGTAETELATVFIWKACLF